MKTLNLLLASSFLLAGAAARANEGSPEREKKEAEHFQEMKQDMLKGLEARIGALQKVHDCIAAAADHAGVKKCREDEHAAMSAFHEMKKQERLKHIEQRQQDLEKEKAELLKTDSSKP